MDDRKIVVALEAVYDASDGMTDYFAPDTPWLRYFVGDYPRKVVNEATLRQFVSKLPLWLQRFNWTYQKGEKYSMSDHPYGQLRVDGQSGLVVPSTSGMNAGRMKPLSFLLTTTTESGYLMNDKKEQTVPPTLAQFIADKDRKMLEREGFRNPSRSGQTQYFGTGKSIAEPPVSPDENARIAVEETLRKWDISTPEQKRMALRQADEFLRREEKMF